MSMKRFGRGAWRIAVELAQHARIVPRIFQPSYKVDVVVRRAVPPIRGGRAQRNPLLRLIQLMVRNHRAISRPLVTIAHHRHNLSERLRFHRFNRFAFRKQARDAGVVERIKDVFGTKERYNPALQKDEVPETIDGYEIGSYISKGCNAAVYALRLRQDAVNAVSMGFSGDPGLAVLPSTSKGTDSARVSPFKRFPLALKLMFNYDLEQLGEEHLWRDMGAELVPLPGSEKKLSGRMGSYRPLPSAHPNVVKIKTAFVDRMPILPDAVLRYPDALPTAELYGGGRLIREPRTMLVVMKRYHMNLHDYVRLPGAIDIWKARIMTAQLLEGVTFLYKNVVAQRDMKSDNILLEFDDYDEVPLLVISDFGCALATGSWMVNYRDNYVDMGGAAATRAPEVVLARPGPSSWVDFSLADTWAAGALVHEIHTRVNPFYHLHSAATYREEELPSLPSRVHYIVKSVVRDMLRRDPKKRVIPSVAANAVALSLFRFGNNMREFLKQCGIIGLNPETLKTAVSQTIQKLSEHTERALDDVLMLVTAETILGRQRPGLSRAEVQLRATFLSRLDRSEMWSAIGYFFQQESNVDAASSATATVASSKPSGRTGNGVAVLA